MRGSGLDPELLAEELELSDGVRAAPSMLSYEERALLRWAARTVDVPGAAIIDAGAFLGGSALALAEGLAARGGDDATIHSYDLFEFSGAWEAHWVPDGFDFAVGRSSQPIVRHTLGDAGRYVVLHPGDIREQRWEGGAVGVLFVDVTKSWSTADHVGRMFLPSLVPGTSIVIQQDQVHWGHPWCAIAMELMSESFEYLGWAWYSSAVYRCVAPVAPDALPASLLEDLSCDEKLALLERFAARLGGPVAETVRLSAAMVLLAHGEYAAARGVIDQVQSRVGDADLPHISEGFAYLHPYVDDVENGVSTIV